MVARCCSQYSDVVKIHTARQSETARLARLGALIQTCLRLKSSSSRSTTSLFYSLSLFLSLSPSLTLSLASQLVQHGQRERKTYLLQSLLVVAEARGDNMVEAALEIQEHLNKAHWTACAIISAAFCENLDACTLEESEHGGADQIKGGWLAREQTEHSCQICLTITTTACTY